MTLPSVILTVIVMDALIVVLLAWLARIVERRKRMREMMSPPPSRSSQAIITELRAALDSGRLDASVARINRRNETRRMQS
jgi:hypothetical protein